MSRGPGVVQRAVLAALDDQPTGVVRGWLSLRELAESIAPSAVTRSRLESVRRAVRSLEAAGVVETDYMDELVDVRAARVAAGEYARSRRRHVADRRHLLVHLRLSVEERALREQHYATLTARLVDLDRRIS